MIAVIDSGTTNIRIRIIQDNKVIYSIKKSIGIKNLSQMLLKQLLYEAFDNINEKIDKLEYCIASGMITSDLGLYKIDHLVAPISLKKLSEKVVKKELFSIPFYFIPGVKNKIVYANMENLSQVDMMRGEEVECIGIMHSCNIKGPALIILPGTHSKFVYINDKNEIDKCVSSMAGEIFETMSKNTILSKSLDGNMIDKIDEKYILNGMNFQNENGFTRSCFAVRLMDVQLKTTVNERANFLAGAIFSSDMTDEFCSSLMKDNIVNIYIGGNDILKGVFSILFNKRFKNQFKIYSLEDKISEMAPVIGAIQVINSDNLEV